MKNNLNLIPLWMKQDQNFFSIIQNIQKIFQEVEDIKYSIEQRLDLNLLGLLTEYDPKLLRNFFKIKREFKVLKGNYYYTIENNKAVKKIALEDKYISLSTQSLCKMVVWKSISFNFGADILEINNRLLKYQESIYSPLIIYLEDSKTEDELPVIQVTGLELSNNNLEQYVEECTLFINGFFNLNFLGAIARYKLNDEYVYFTWDESKWDDGSIWRF